MNCPPEIADIITRLIEAGILRIRAAAWAGDSARCAVEADHIHNLPGLLTNFSSETLRYYWEVEMPAFLAQSGEVSGIVSRSCLRVVTPSFGKIRYRWDSTVRLLMKS